MYSQLLLNYWSTHHTSSFRSIKIQYLFYDIRHTQEKIALHLTNIRYWITAMFSGLILLLSWLVVTHGNAVNKGKYMTRSKCLWFLKRKNIRRCVFGVRVPQTEWIISSSRRCLARHGRTRVGALVLELVSGAGSRSFFESLFLLHKACSAGCEKSKFIPPLELHVAVALPTFS